MRTSKAAREQNPYFLTGRGKRKLWSFLPWASAKRQNSTPIARERAPQSAAREAARPPREVTGCLAGTTCLSRSAKKQVTNCSF
jgi:hypothetical protein